MKILIVNTYYYLRGGDSIYSFNLAELLQKNGHEVFFFSMNHPQNFSTKFEKYFVDYIDFVEMNQNKNFENIKKVLLSSIYNKQARIKISQIIKDYKPNLVHLNNIHAHITTSIIPEIKKHYIPIVWTLHDYKLVCPNTHFLIDKTGEICEACKGGKFFNPIFKKCKKNSLGASFVISLEAYFNKIVNYYKLIDCFICPSQFLMNKLIEHGFDKKKLKHIPNFIWSNFIKYNFSNKGYVLFFGRVSKIKGFDILLKLAQKFPDLDFKVAGSIDSNIKINDFILPNNLELLGFKDKKELSYLIDNSFYTIAPSLSFENYPYSVLESFSRGKPVIASDLGGLRELIGSNEERGYLFNPNNIEELFDKIRFAFSDMEIYKRKSKNAFDYVNLFNREDVYYDQIHNLYSNLTKK